MVNFPYKKSDQGIYFPIVNFTVYFKNNASKTSALIDSGATISIFREDVAEQLGIKIENGEKITLGGVGGRIVGYIHKLNLRIADKVFICSVVFSREYTVSLNLLGRSDFFDRFKIIFEEKKKVIKLE